MTLRAPQVQPEYRRGLIDLHLHTTASDGWCTPGELIARAAAARLTIIAVTDHDTTGAVSEVRRLAGEAGMEAVPGIEITAIDDGVDVHVLGYFLDPDDPALQAFLSDQRAQRIARVEAIADRLRALAMPVDLTGAIAEVRRDPSRAIGRPQVARAMIAAGYVADTVEAFERWLGRGLPAFVPRSGATPAEVIATIHGAGGLASLAHPGRTQVDHRIRALHGAGLDAIEVFHSDHDAAQIAGYYELARELGCLVSGGSDFHGDPSRRVVPGAATLPASEWQRLYQARARHA